MNATDLIGRDRELAELRAALDDPEIRVVVVEGQSGAGKTALVDAVVGERHTGGAIVGRGKYADGSASSTFLPILDALSEAVNNALELLYNPVAGAASLRHALQPQLSLLANAGLRVADITPAGPDPIPGSVEGSAARIVEAAIRLMGWLKGFGVPIVLFIDDWHRAPRDAHRFLMAVAREPDIGSLVLAERHAPSPIPRELASRTAQITLGPLEERDRLTLLDATARAEGAGPAIAEWLGSSASGLPFDLIEAARALDERSALVRSEIGWSIDETRAASVDRADVSEAILRRVGEFSEQTLRSATAIALWGDSAPLDLVAETLSVPFDTVVADAERLKSRGLVAIAGLRAHMLHDRLRAALLAALPPETRAVLAGQMSDRMAAWPEERWRQNARTGLYLRLAGGVESASPAVWRDRFALGSLLARTVADTSAATEFAEAAWRLHEKLAPADADAERIILREATIAAAARRDRPALEMRARALIAAAGQAERGDAYEIAVLAARLGGEADLAWHWVLEGFRGFGMSLPATATFSDLVVPIVQWRAGLLFRPSGTTQNAGLIDPLVRLANIAAVIAFDWQPVAAMLIALKAANHARRRGYSDPIWLATDAFISAGLGDHKRAAELGGIAARNAEHSAFSPATTRFRALYFGVTFRQPLAELFDACEEIYQSSIAEGDVVNAALAVRHDARMAWRVAPTREALLTRLAEDERRAERLADDQAISAVREFVQYANVLGTPGAEFPDLSAPVNPVDYVEVLSLQGDWPGVVSVCERMKDLRPQLDVHPGGITWRFHETLARLRMGLKPKSGDVRYIRRAAALNPVDHRCKILLLDAEKARARGDRGSAIASYTLAVDFAARSASRLEEGLIAEYAAFGSRVMGDEDGSTRYAARAEQIWRHWGALAKLGAATPEPPQRD